MKINNHIYAIVTHMIIVTISILLYEYPYEVSVCTNTGNIIHSWSTSWIRILHLPVLFLSLVVSFFLWRWLNKLEFSEKLPKWVKNILYSLPPITFLPNVILASHSSEWFGIVITGLILPFGASAIFAWMLYRWLDYNKTEELSSNAYAPKLISWLTLVMIVILCIFLHDIMKYYNGGGDFKHYNNQVNSLIERRSLNLAEDFPEITAQFHSMPPEKAAQTDLSHLKINAKGEVYSYHTYGFPIIIWPFIEFGGRYGRLLYLLLVSVFAFAGVRASCRAIGVSSRLADTASVLLSLSYMWAMYAFASLPEGLGCALVAWAFWGLMAQHDKERRWPTTIVAAICCAYLPMAHIRFTPEAGMLALFFGLEGLFFVKDETIKKKIVRLATFSVICITFWAILFVSQKIMYHYPVEGATAIGAYNYKKVLFGYPLAMWGVIAYDRSLGVLLPVVFWLIIAVIRECFVKTKTARWALYAFVVSATVLMTCCSTTAALGGACIPGRYFLQAIPVLFPFGLLAFNRSSAMGKFWYLFLMGIPVLFFLFLAPNFIGSQFIKVPEAMFSVEQFHNFWSPRPSHEWFGTDEPYLECSLYVASLFLISVVLMGNAYQRVRYSLGVLLLLCTFGLGLYANHISSKDYSDSANHLTRHPHFKHNTLVLTPETKNIYDIFCDGSTLTNSKPKIILSDKKLSKLQINNRIDVSKIPPNDWAGRSLRWWSVRQNGAVRQNYDGGFVARVRGNVLKGDANFAVRQGSHTLWEGKQGLGKFDIMWIIPTKKGWGFTDIITSFENNIGESVIYSDDVMPYISPTKNLPFPNDVKVINLFIKE